MESTTESNAAAISTTHYLFNLTQLGDTEYSEVTHQMPLSPVIIRQERSTQEKFLDYYKSIISDNSKTYNPMFHWNVVITQDGATKEKLNYLQQKYNLKLNIIIGDWHYKCNNESNNHYNILPEDSYRITLSDPQIVSYYDSFSA